MGAVRDHVVARCYGAMPKSGYQVPYSYGGNEKAPLKLRESANTNFLLARDNRVKRHKVHPRNYPGCPPFRERAKRKRQPSSGEVTRALLLTYLLRRLAPTLVVAFRKAPTPDFRYLKRRSNHSATVAGSFDGPEPIPRVAIMPLDDKIRFFKLVIMHVHELNYPILK